MDGAAGTIRATDGEDALDTTTLLGIAHAERARLGRVVQFASPESWEAPSPCQGWRNRDVMAHLAAQETAAVQVVRGEAPEEFDAFRAANGGEFWVDGFNESAVRVRAEVPTRRVLEDWGRAADLLLADLGALDDEAWRTRRAPWVAGEIGIRYLVQSRVVEWWFHGEDVREGAELDPNPQHWPIHLANDLAIRMLPWSLGTAGIALPGRTVRFDLEGVGGGSWLWSLSGREAPDPDRKPDAFVQGRAVAFALVAGRRFPPMTFLDAGDLVVGGDEDLAFTVLDHLRAFAA